jgi:hypothetical protein
VECVARRKKLNTDGTDSKIAASYGSNVVFLRG